MIFGKNSAVTVALGERIIKQCNSQGTSLLGLGDTKAALAMFKKASEVLGRMPTSAGDYATKLELRCLTYSNLGWYYFCTKDYYPALQYAQKAQSSANVSQDQRAMAAAHLNIGCCVSMLGCHDGALDHATKALYLLQAERGGTGANSAVAVCLHNIAVEQILLYRMGENINAGEALETCTDAIEIAKEVLDPNHAWMRHFKRTFKIAVKMSPSVEALRKSSLGPLRRAKSASPALFAKSKSRSQPYGEEDYDYRTSDSLPPVQGAQRYEEMDRSQSVPINEPGPAPAPPHLPTRLHKTRIAPPGKLPTLPSSLTQPHAFNPSGGALRPIGVEEDEEDTKDDASDGGASRGPVSRSAILGLGGAAMLKNSLGSDNNLNKLIKKRSEMIRSTNMAEIPRLMPKGADEAEEEEEMTFTATSSANVVETGIVESEPLAQVEEPDGPEEASAGPREPPGEEAEEDYEEEEYEEEAYEDDDFEATSPTGGVSEADKAAAAERIQRIARGRQGRKKAQQKREWKSSQAAWKSQAAGDDGKEAAARQIQRITRGKQGRRKAHDKAQQKASGTFRSDMTAGGPAAEELQRQRAALKIQALSRGRQERKATQAKKEEYDTDPSKKPKGYKAFSEYDGEGKDNPYFVKLNTTKKKKGGPAAGSVYLEQQYAYTHENAAKKIQAAQRGKIGRRKASHKKVMRAG